MFRSRGTDCDNQGRALAKAKSTKNMHKVHKMRTMTLYRYIKFDIKKPKVDGDLGFEYSGLRPSAAEARHAGDSIHTARGGAIVLSLQRCTMRCQIELCAGVIYLIRGQDTQIIELGKRMFANVSQSWRRTLPGGAYQEGSSPG